MFRLSFFFRFNFGSVCFHFIRLSPIVAKTKHTLCVQNGPSSYQAEHFKLCAMCILHSHAAFSIHIHCLLIRIIPLSGSFPLCDSCTPTFSLLFAVSLPCFSNPVFFSDPVFTGSPLFYAVVSKSVGVLRHFFCLFSCIFIATVSKQLK